MRNKSYIFIIAILILLGSGSISAQGKINLSLRQSLYFTGEKTDTIDKSKDLYVGAGKTMDLKTSQAAKCDYQGSTIIDCYFNIGALTWREIDGKITDKGTLSTYGLFKGYDGSLVGNTIFFADKTGTKEAVFPVRMQIGMNQVTFTVDPENKIAESNENDNSLTVNFNITNNGGKPPIRKPKRIDK